MASSEGMEGLDTGHESATASVTERAVVSSGGMKGLDTGHESVTASVIESASPSPSSDSQAGDIKNVSLDLHLLNLLLALLVGPVTSTQSPVPNSPNTSSQVSVMASCIPLALHHVLKENSRIKLFIKVEHSGNSRRLLWLLGTIIP